MQNIYLKMNTKNFTKSVLNENNGSKTSISIELKLEEKIKGKVIKPFLPKYMREKEKTESSPEIKLNKDAKEYIPTKNRINKETNKKKKRTPSIPSIKRYSYEDLLKFESMEISNKTDLLDEEVLKHINEMEITIKEYEKKYTKIIEKSIRCSDSKSIKSSDSDVSMKQWSRKDYTKEEQTAEKNKEKFKENDKKNKDIKELRGIMNIMTKDNYDKIKCKIVEIIQNDVKLQEQFLQIFYKKVIMESAYIELYVELSRFLNLKLKQKSEKNKKSSLFREILIEKCKEVLREKDFNNYVDEQDQQEKENKIKNLNLGNINLLVQMVKIKMLSKKIIPECFEHLFKKYQSEEKTFLKVIYAQTIISLTDKYATLINSEKDKIKNNEYIKSVDVFFKNLEIIKNDKCLPGHIKYLIINLIEKRKNNYKESKCEKSRLAKSKKELEEELYNEEDTTEEAQEEEQEEVQEEDKEKEQEKINEEIKKDLSEYKDYVEEKGSSDKYPWITITKLYDMDLKSFDDIIEGFIIASEDFINKNKNNMKYVKDYISELISFYGQLMDDEEKNDLRKKVFSLLELVRDLSLDTPNIYEVYAYILFVFVKNEIMEIEDLKNVLDDGSNEEDIKILNTVLKNLYENNKSETFKKELRKIDFIIQKKGAFEWVFSESKNQ